MIKRRQKKIGYAIIETKSDILIKKKRIVKMKIIFLLIEYNIETELDE